MRKTIWNIKTGESLSLAAIDAKDCVNSRLWTYDPPVPVEVIEKKAFKKELDTEVIKKTAKR